MHSRWLKLIPVEAWEQAFLDEGPIEQGQRDEASKLGSADANFEAIVVAAFRQARVDLAELRDNDAEDAPEIVCDILEAFQVARVGLDFPDAGDGLAARG